MRFLVLPLLCLCALTASAEETTRRPAVSQPMAVSASAPAASPTPAAATTATVATDPLAPPALPPLSAQEVLAAAKPSVFRLSTHLKGASSRMSHGTAFVVDPNGLLVSNYHVVMDYLLSEGDNELQLELGDGKTLPASVVSVDVVNDLSLVRVNNVFPQALALAEPNASSEGEVVYSMGFPANDNLTFTQGNYGGEKMVGFATAVLASMPLNHGMSGGPTLNGRAQVIGVNRAMLGAAQNLSYFSPLTALRGIVQAGAAATGRAPASKGKEWADTAVSQVRRQEQMALAQPASGQKRERIGGVSFSIPLPNQSCGQGKASEKSSRADSPEIFFCRSASLTPLVGKSNGLEVLTFVLADQKGGGVSDEVTSTIASLYSRERREILKQPKKKGERGLAQVLDSAKARKGTEYCGLRNVKNGKGVQMTVSYCSVRNQFFEGLYSTFVKVDVQREGDKLRIGQAYQGLSDEATAAILEKFLESVELEGGAT